MSHLNTLVPGTCLFLHARGLEAEMPGRGAFYMYILKAVSLRRLLQKAAPAGPLLAVRESASPESSPALGVTILSNLDQSDKQNMLSFFSTFLFVLKIVFIYF